MCQTVQTSSDADTIFVRDGVVVYPCRCGVEHTGDYAIETQMRHECLHDCALLRLTADVVMCPLCAASWPVNGEPMVGDDWGGMVAVDYGLDEEAE
jgi:hypothetical protein